MSGIISSYLIDPVIRQARRFFPVKPGKSSSEELKSKEDRVQEIPEKLLEHDIKLSSTRKESIQQKIHTDNALRKDSPDNNTLNYCHPSPTQAAENQNQDPLCACAQSHVTLSLPLAVTHQNAQDPPNTLNASTTVSNNSLTTTATTNTINYQHTPLSCPLHPLPTTASLPQSVQLPVSYMSDRPPQISSYNHFPDVIVSTRSATSHQTLLRSRSLGSLFSASVFSDRDWSECSRRESHDPCLTDFRRSSRLPTMDNSEEGRARRQGSDASAPARLDTDLIRRNTRTRRYSWSDTRRSRTSDRRPPLHEHYTDSLLVTPDENSRTKQDEDIISREGDLRRKIQDICQLSITNEEKAKRIHYVMNEQYLCKMEEQQRKKSSDDLLRRPRSSNSCESEVPSEQSGIDIELYTRFNVTPDDLVPTRRPRRHSEDTATAGMPNFAMTPLQSGTPQSEDEPAEPEYELGCEHYKRNVKIQCFECKNWWNCRYCHDAVVHDHSLPRHKTENMLCMLCQTPGPAGQYCEHCGEQSAYYFCEICKLWDDDSTKRIYHCTDCGICRLGEGLGKDFQHCKRCNVCIPFQQFSWHKCLERATDCDCPICGDYMFSSKAPIVSMPCGHYLHRTCYNQYMLNSYQCPICKKSARNMESQWRKMEEETARQPMPLNLRSVSVDVRCNDCGGKSRVPYHWLGNKCSLCDSFNTTEIEIHRDGGGLTPASPSPPRGNWRSVRAVPQRRVRRYFEEDEEISDPQRSPNGLGDTVNAESLLGLPNTAYELFATMTRNLSPIRRYLNNREENNTAVVPEEGAATEGEIERMGFWRSATNPNNEAWEEEEEDDIDDDDDESTDEEGPYMFDDDSDSDSEGGLGLDALDIVLIGHR